MADCLEGDHSEDADRLIDSCSFQSSQFEIFTHDFREYSELPPPEAHSSCECGKKEGSCRGESQDDQKKDIVNTLRKMQRAKFALQSMEGNTPLSDFIQQFESTIEELNTFLRADKAEFSPTSVPLPDFDPVDMELLLGKESTPHQPTMLEAIEMSKKNSKDRITRLLGESQILLAEYDHIKRGI